MSSLKPTRGGPPSKTPKADTWMEIQLRHYKELKSRELEIALNERDKEEEEEGGKEEEEEEIRKSKRVKEKSYRRSRKKRRKRRKRERSSSSSSSSSSSPSSSSRSPSSGDSGPSEERRRSRRKKQSRRKRKKEEKNEISEEDEEKEKETEKSDVNSDEDRDENSDYVNKDDTNVKEGSDNQWRKNPKICKEVVDTKVATTDNGKEDDDGQDLIDLTEPKYDTPEKTTKPDKIMPPLPKDKAEVKTKAAAETHTPTREQGTTPKKPVDPRTSTSSVRAKEGTKVKMNDAKDSEKDDDILSLHDETMKNEIDKLGKDPEALHCHPPRHQAQVVACSFFNHRYGCRKDWWENHGKGTYRDKDRDRKYMILHCCETCLEVTGHVEFHHKFWRNCRFFKSHPPISPPR